MRKILSPLIVAGLLSAAGLAFAAGSALTATGRIKAVDMLKHTVTFEDGSTYKIASGVNIRDMKVGRKVTLRYAGTGPITEASAIEPVDD